MVAYTVREDNEGSGGVVFAKSNIEARRVGADLYNNGEFGGLMVHRAPSLDQYEKTGRVPARVMVEMGWWFKCAGTGMTINEDSLFDERLPVAGVVGFSGGEVFCCDVVEAEYCAAEAGKKAYGEAFLARMKRFIEKRYPHINPYWGEGRHYVDVVTRDGVHLIEAAVVRFQFPGSKYGADYRYSPFNRPHGLHGPVEAEITVARADLGAWDAMRNARPSPTPEGDEADG